MTVHPILRLLAALLVLAAGPAFAQLKLFGADPELLDPEQRDTLTRAASELLARAAVVEDGLANWPAAASSGRPPRERSSVKAAGIGLTSPRRIAWRFGARSHSDVSSASM